MKDDKSLTIITGEITQIQENVQRLFKEKTPKEVIKQRKGAGGKMFPYIPIDYTVSKLDEKFGIFWEFEVITTQETPTHVVCQGKLTIKSPNGFSISRPGFGRAAIKFYKDSTKPVDIGNDYKAAQSDALKKAASLFGIGADVYYKELEKYEEIENQQTEDEAKKQAAMGQYFAKAQERGMDADIAKEKIKTAFKVAHMDDLRIDQLNYAMQLLEKQYEIVEPGEEPRRKGITKIEVIESESEPLPWEAEKATGATEVTKGEEESEYYCKGTIHNPANPKSMVKVPVGQFCSEACRDSYYPPKQQLRDWGSLGKKKEA